MRLSLAFSSCPNDTFIFDAMVHDRIDTEGLSFDVHLGDVEELNQYAFAGKFDITKLSYHAFGYLTDHYELLDAGSALGRGVGPLLVTADPDYSPDRQPERPVAIPGKYTTANYLLGLAYPELANKREVLFSDIEDRVLSGEFAAGLLIHENRFTYHERGLRKIRDLGEYWEETTRLPIPLGGIVIRKSLPDGVKAKVNQLLSASVRYAFDHPTASADYVARHAQVLSEDVRRKHIDLYVNEFSLDLGREGKAAVAAFLEQGRERGVLPAAKMK